MRYPTPDDPDGGAEEIWEQYAARYVTRARVARMVAEAGGIVDAIGLAGDYGVVLPLAPAEAAALAARLTAAFKDAIVAAIMDLDDTHIADILHDNAAVPAFDGPDW